MKSYICVGLLCIFFQAIYAFEESDLDQTDLKCLEELSYDKNTILNSYDKNDFLVEGNEKVNKFFECAWIKDALISADGSVHLENLEKMVRIKLEKLFPEKEKEKYRNHLAKESVKACKGTTGRTNGDTCVKMYNCLLKKVGEFSQKVKPEEVN